MPAPARRGHGKYALKWGMARHPLFLEDAPVAHALDEASDAALRHLAGLLPELAGDAGLPFRERLRAHLAAMLTGRSGAPAAPPELPALVHGDDAFGDRFRLDDLPLPRAGAGYAVQLLDTDRLLDRHSGAFLPVRDPALAGLFDSFDSAHAAARAWVRAHGTTADRHPLAIVPACYDEKMHRHVLIYGVLTQLP